MKTIFAGARPADSNCVVASQTAKGPRVAEQCDVNIQSINHKQPRSRHRSWWRSFPRLMSPQTADRTIPRQLHLFLAGISRQYRYGTIHLLDIFVQSFPECRVLALQEWHQPYLMSC
ncbi:hypothetical protein TNCV_1220451 [Trichonephila clavipes]|nr:hypothetical protein TNCV_1220451 [Trichonephila clavipes]